MKNIRESSRKLRRTNNKNPIKINLIFKIADYFLLGRAQPVIPPNLYSINEHNSLGSSGKLFQNSNSKYLEI